MSKCFSQVVDAGLTDEAVLWSPCGSLKESLFFCPLISLITVLHVGRGEAGFNVSVCTTANHRNLVSSRVFRKQQWWCPHWGAAESADSPAETDGLPPAPGFAWPQPADELGAQAGLAEAWAGGDRPIKWREPSPSHLEHTHLLKEAARSRRRKGKKKKKRD